MLTYVLIEVPVVSMQDTIVKLTAQGPLMVSLSLSNKIPTFDWLHGGFEVVHMMEETFVSVGID